jgi:hypothetical protein
MNQLVLRLFASTVIDGQLLVLGGIVVEGELILCVKQSTGCQCDDWHSLCDAGWWSVTLLVCVFNETWG